MKKHLLTFALALMAGVLCYTTSFAQTSAPQTSAPQTSAPEEFKPSGAFTFQLFADYFYQMNSDTAALFGKAPSSKGSYYAPNSQYFQAFDIRRVYLGYDYNFTRDISAQLLLSHENGTSATTNVVTSSTATYDSVKKTVTVTNKTAALPTSSSGDIVLDGNRGLYIKAANIRFKNWVPMAAVIMGQQGTAAFALTEQVWGYRSIEKTIMDFRGMAQSNDLGIQLQGNFDADKAFGYSAMISNGNGAKAENDKYKKYAAELNAKLMDKHVILEAYADYMDRSNAASITTGSGTTAVTATNVAQSNTTLKFMAAYMSDVITGGVEYAMQTQKGQSLTNSGDDAKVSGLSIFARGYILPKQLMWFARYDMYDPNTAASSDNNSGRKENFITAGLDIQPDATTNVHIMPNIWMNTFKDKSATASDYESIFVARLTFFAKF